MPINNFIMYVHDSYMYLDGIYMQAPREKAIKNE